MTYTDKYLCRVCGVEREGDVHAVGDAEIRRGARLFCDMNLQMAGQPSLEKLIAGIEFMRLRREIFG